MTTYTAAGISMTSLSRTCLGSGIGLGCGLHRPPSCYTEGLPPQAIDLLHSSVKMSEAEAELNQFEITTGRCLYLLKPKDGESSAAGWVEKITETMLALEEGGTDHVHNAADRDYGAALQGYSNVKPDDVRS